MPLTGLVIGGVLGFILQRGRYCTTGAFRDVFFARKTRWFSSFILLIAVHAVGLWALVSLGVIHLDSKGFPWAATIIGAFIFGASMVVAGGCATGTYYRAGEGLVGSWFALGMYALTASIMKHGPLSGFTESMRDIEISQGAIYETLHVSPWVLTIILAAVAAWLTIHHNRGRAKVATLPPRYSGVKHLLLEKRWNPFATAAVIGVIATIGWVLSAAAGRNSGLGVTTPSANLVTYLASGDVELVDWGVYFTVSLIIGSFIAAKASGEFRLRVPDATTVVKSILGGIGMGFGAALAGGCTVGNGMVQTAMMTWQGWVSFAFMVIGAGVAAKLTIGGGTSQEAASEKKAPVRA